MEEKKRERYLDIAKGIGILCIVLLHLEDGVFPVSLCVFIGSFMIPIFFITVGWLDAQRAYPLSLGELIKKRWKQLAVPYLWWSGLILLFDIVLWILGYYDTYFICRETYKTVVLRGIGTLWFLPALFGGEVIWNVIRRRHSILIAVVAVILTVLLQNVYGEVFGGRDGHIVKIIQAPFYTLNNMLGAWIGIAAGFTFRRLFERINLDKLKRWTLFVLGLVCCVAAYFAANYCPIPILWVLGAPIIGPVGILLLSMSVENLRIVEYLNYWGCNSMALMVTHYSFLMVLCDIFNRMAFNQSKIVGYPAFVYFVVIMILEYYITEFISKKYPFLLGK